MTENGRARLSGRVVGETTKVKISEEVLQEILYFTDYKKFPSKTVEDITNNRLSMAILVKRSSENLPGDIDEIVLQVVYGNPRKPPGDEKSPNQKLMVKIEEDKNEEEKINDKENESGEEKEEEDSGEEEGSGEEKEEEKDAQKVEENILLGVWAPPNSLAKATVLKYLFPNISGPYVNPEKIEPSPLYVAVGYDAFKAMDIIELSEQYPGQVMNYGFFTSDIPAEAQLIVKTVDEFEERKAQSTYDEKIVIQLSKSNPECYVAFCELGPTYMSPDAIVGEQDCNVFFPPGYSVVEEEVKEEKKKQKKKGKKHVAAVNKEASVATSEVTVDHIENEMEQIEDENEEQDSEDEKRGSEEGESDDGAAGADKATSPIHQKGTEE